MTDDYLIRATAAEGEIRAFAAISTNLVEEARYRHGTSPVATAALGRLMTGAVMMGSMMKGDKDILTLSVKGDGPLGGLVVTADSHGNVKGYAMQPLVLLPAKNGKLDVGGAVGNGILSVTKDLGLKEPYGGQIKLVSGEIAEDLTYYFAVSEQVPSSVGLGVLMEKTNHVKRAGGFIIQLMPEAKEETLIRLEENLNGIKPVTTMLDEGMSIEEMLSLLLKDLGPEIYEKQEIRFHCNCSRERVMEAVASIGEKEIRSLIDEGKDVEVKCHFCNTTYTYTVDEMRNILVKGVS
ncbi:MAG: Hsp33 family molecular chaperone HslO [Lachnospiraceae bacterium]|jgi:molecular chaperone Hsp33|nr:Hsp33 family molecular chaperone HslO [Lachnospiraceae bacterium]